MKTFALNLLADAVGLASVKLSGPAGRQFGVTIGAGKGLTHVLLLKGLLPIDVVHFDMRSPALARKNALAADMNTSEMHLGHLIILLVNFRRINTRRVDHFLSADPGHLLLVERKNREGGARLSLRAGSERLWSSRKLQR